MITLRAEDKADFMAWAGFCQLLSIKGTGMSPPLRAVLLSKEMDPHSLRFLPSASINQALLCARILLCPLDGKMHNPKRQTIRMLDE